MGVTVKTKLLICLIALLATGCTLFDRQEKRINYTKMLDWGGQSLVTDAKQRAIINTKAEVGIGDTRYGAEDTTDDQVVKNHPHRIICAGELFIVSQSSDPGGNGLSPLASHSLLREASFFSPPEYALRNGTAVGSRRFGCADRAH